MKCGNCIHWKRDENNRIDVLDDVRDPGLIEYSDDYWMTIRDEKLFKQITGVLVKVCTNPKIKHYELPQLGTASVVDGSGYKGNLITEETFGCTLFEAK